MLRGHIQDECETLACEGLRTLVLTQKFFTQSQYDAWNTDFQAAQCDMKDREKKVQRQMEKLESRMDLLGITGVEDKLQDNVQ